MMRLGAVPVRPASTFAQGDFGSYVKKDMTIRTQGTSSAMNDKYSKISRIMTWAM